MKICVVMVTNKLYLERCLATIWQLRLFGLYRGEVVLIVGDDLREQIPTLGRLGLKIIPRYFPEIDRSNQLERIMGGQGLSGTEESKGFQFHKFYCFDEFFLKWDRVLYVDAGMRVIRPIREILELDCSGSLLAHSDAFPTFVWRLENQFNLVDFPETRDLLGELVPLDSDYFQTTMMYFDTNIIQPQTVQDLRNLMVQFPNSRTNDQGIINLWALARNLWKRLPTHNSSGPSYYDFHERNDMETNDYILLKYPRQPRMRRQFLSDLLFNIYWRLVARRESTLKA